MCHSVEVYMPKLVRDAAEHRLGAADFAVSRRERAAADSGLRLLIRLARWLGAGTKRGTDAVAQARVVRAAGNG
jgi:hypothetical protein